MGGFSILPWAGFLILIMHLFCGMVTNALFWTAKQNVRQTKIPEVKTPEKKEEPLQLYLRSKLQGFKASDAWRDVYFNEEWKTNETAIIICDMWDKHWCKGATERCEALAVKMNPVCESLPGSWHPDYSCSLGYVGFLCRNAAAAANVTNTGMPASGIARYQRCNVAD